MRADPNTVFCWRTPDPIVVKDVIVIGGQPLAIGVADVNRPSLRRYPWLQRPHRQAALDLPHGAARR
jgi:hypothetical protein